MSWFHCTWNTFFCWNIPQTQRAWLIFNSDVQKYFLRYSEVTSKEDNFVDDDDGQILIPSSFSWTIEKVPKRGIKVQLSQQPSPNYSEAIQTILAPLLGTGTTLNTFHSEI